MSLKCVCFWCAKDISDGSRCPHPEMSDAVASLLVRLEATTMCPETDNNLRRGNILEADLRRAREEEAERWIDAMGWTDLIHDGGYTQEDRKGYVKLLIDSVTHNMVPADELQKVCEEATVAAAHAQREADKLALIERNRQLKSVQDGGTYDFSQPDWDDLDEGVTAIGNAPIVTSDEGKKWLRERDAGVRAAAYEKCRTAVSAMFTPMGAQSQSLWAMFNRWMKEASAQSTGTPE